MHVRKRISRKSLLYGIFYRKDQLHFLHFLISTFLSNFFSIMIYDLYDLQTTQKHVLSFLSVNGTLGGKCLTYSYNIFCKHF